MTARFFFQHVSAKLRKAFTAKPVDRHALDRSFKIAFCQIVDIVIADKDVPNPKTTAGRCGLFIRNLERIGKILTTASIGGGIGWVMWFYSFELGHLPTLTSLGDIFTVAVIGVTGPLLSLTLCTLVLWSGVSLGMTPTPNTSGISRPEHDEHLGLYGGFFAGAVFSAMAFVLLVSTPGAVPIAVAIAVDLVGPFSSAALVALLVKAHREAFRLRWAGFFSASVLWGLASVLGGLLLARSVVDVVQVSGTIWLVAVVTFALIATLSALPARFGLIGAFSAYCTLFLVAALFGGPLLRDAPFRLWHIGGLTKRVTFTDREEERKARARCKLQSLREKHTYSIYMLSDLPQDKWYRCYPVHVLANKAPSIPRQLDPSNVLVEDY